MTGIIVTIPELAGRKILANNLLNLGMLPGITSIPIICHTKVSAAGQNSRHTYKTVLE